MQFVKSVVMSAALASLVVAGTAHAGNGNGGGNGNGNAGGNGSAASAGNSQGSIASELKGLNAAHASATAMLHANPKSQVGRIAAYKGAAEATLAAQAALDAMVEPTRSIAEIEAAIAGLNPAATGYDADLAALEAEKAAAEAYVDAQTSVARLQVVEDASLLVASNDRVLSAAALGKLREMLGL